MKDLFAGIAAFVSGFVGIVVLIGGLSYLGWASYDYFAPKYRATDNKVFKESEQYNDGMVRDLENLQMEYTDADQAHKDALRAIVLHRFSVYPEDKMPPNLRNFYNQLRSGK
jgi:hypothetical protein